ncbi:SWIM zinc finger family protein [Streptomyces sp. LN704]|uniref:SWIM zinc finger family protein n=1 Tax=Streptomyces sp. LN704 TaxID=3112982 RepID=UPI0037181E2F
MSASTDEGRPEPGGTDGQEEPRAAGSARPATEGARPADAARRALRAAREREGRGAVPEDEPDPPAEATPVTPVTPVTPGGRPGDAARQALRRAAGRGSVPGAGAGEVPPVEGTSGPAPEPAASDEPSADETATGPDGQVGTAPGVTRPADVARQALRAARSEARQARTDAGDEAAEPRHRFADRTPPTGSPARRIPRGHDPGARTRDVRDLLAGVFELPDTDPRPRTTRAPIPDATPLPGARTAAGPETPDAGSPNRRATPAEAPRATLAGAEPSETAADTETAGSTARDTETAGSTARGTETAGPMARDTESAGPTARGTETAGPTARGTESAGSTAQVTQTAGSTARDTESAGPTARGTETAGSTAQVTQTDGPIARGTATGRTIAGRTDTTEAPPGHTRATWTTESPEGDSVVPGERSAPRAGRLPRSMGSPGRDGELRRTFPTLPARTPDAEAFARTWWGNAWVSALEEGALDAARLARGRAYADKGRVDAITVTPGLVLAYVHGSRPRPYRVQVALRTLDDGDWDRFLDAAAERPGHIAALLDKEMPRSLADCGVDLLPGPGDLAPHCSCPDSGHPCKHAAALCYETARLLDEDPFVLLLLRGRGERELLDQLSRRNAARAARAAQEQEPASLPGVRARDALARRSLPPLPAPLPAPAHPEQPPTYPGAPGGPDPFALDQLATDAAARAHALLTAGRDPVAELTLWQDAVRLAAARPGSGLTAATRALYSSLASAAGRTPADLARAVAAWRQGGIEGLSVLEEPWDPPAGRFDRARPLLLAADLPAFRPWRNRLTHSRGHAQLRLGHDGLWYAYESEPGQDDWWPRGTPDLDPVGALTGLGAPGE